MQTSAKTKARELFRTKLAANLAVEDITELLLEHERDTRYTAIDILNSMEDLGGEGMPILIELSEAVSQVHNLKVGEIK